MQVSWSSLDEQENPQNWALSRKWALVRGLESGLWVCTDTGSVDCLLIHEWDCGMCSFGHWSRCLEVVSPSPPFRGAQNKLTSLISDCWNADQRGKAVGIYSLAPLLGPVVGPIAGVVIQLVGLAFLLETHKPTLLKRRAKTLSKESDGLRYHTEFDSDQSLVSTLKTALVRLFLLLTTQPIVQVIALYMAYLLGLFYFLLSTFPGVWEGVYGEDVGIAGLNYISLGVGFVLGAQVNARMSDRIYHRLKMKRNNTGAPEFRIPAMFVRVVAG